MLQEPRSSHKSKFSPKRNGNGTSFKDPAFLENKTLPIHRWVPWIAGYSASFVQSVLGTYPYENATDGQVLDPFAGVGTTLVQAAINGHNVVGFEINPYAALVCNTKLRASDTDLRKFDLAVGRLLESSDRWNIAAPKQRRTPPGFRSRIPFYSESIERQVLNALDFISRIRDPIIRDQFRIAFGAIMVSFSNYTYEPSLGSRPAAGKSLIEDADVAGTLLSKLHQMRTDTAWWKAQANNGLKPGIGQVHCADFLSENTLLKDGSVSLMITSPPYLNNYHYVRNTRPQMYWLSLIATAAEQRPLEERNFGKYWQVVREQGQVPLTFKHPGLSRDLSVLRKTREDKGIYGGGGWANYATAYFNDCHRLVDALHRILIRDGVGAIVIGNSILQGIEIKVDKYLADIASKRGFKVEGIERVREKRVGASITQSTVRRGESSGATLYESVVVLRRP